jgi:SAM-dependent methyltransferase
VGHYELCAKSYKPDGFKARLIMLENSPKLRKGNKVAQSSSDMDIWYQSPLGDYLAQEIKFYLDKILATCFGYYAIQIGCTPLPEELLSGCRVKHVFHLGQQQLYQDAEIDPGSLPIANDSTDLVILTHTLSQFPEPHALLREVNRVLIPDGKLIIIDFNPVSLWGLRHLFQSWLEEVPWGGHYYTARRLKDWTSLLGFELLHHYRCGYVFPINFKSLIDKSGVLSKFSARWLKFSAAINVLEFEKNTIPLTPERKRWLKHRVLSPKVIRPSVGRGMKYDK